MVEQRVYKSITLGFCIYFAFHAGDYIKQVFLSYLIIFTKSII